MCVVFIILAGGSVEKTNVFKEVPHLSESAASVRNLVIPTYEKTEVPDVGAVRPRAAEQHLRGAEAMRLYCREVAVALS